MFIGLTYVQNVCFQRQHRLTNDVATDQWCALFQSMHITTQW